jgi:ribosome-associated translation inhibitor RaiA
VSETDHDLRAVIDRASDELAQAVQRHTERVRTRRRDRGRKLVRHAKLGV